MGKRRKDFEAPICGPLGGGDGVLVPVVVVVLAVGVATPKYAGGPVGVEGAEEVLVANPSWERINGRGFLASPTPPGAAGAADGTVVPFFALTAAGWCERGVEP